VKHYEAMFVLHNRELPEGETADPEEVVRTVVERAGGQVAGSLLWANRKLAYPIQGNQTGTYVLSWLTAEPDLGVRLAREVALSERLLRHAIFSIAAIPEESERPGPLAEPAARGARRPGSEGPEGEVAEGEREKKLWENLDYKNVYQLRRMVTSQGKLFSRVRSNLHAKHQRKLRQAVLRARVLALLPFVSR
jgi:small subunit ribosomal protein S18